MYTITPGTEAHLPELLDLVRQLADYERGLHLVTNSVEQMRAEGFGPNPAFEYALSWVERDGTPVAAGMAVWYWRYSTWRGRVLYLEDLFVSPDFRGLGLGKALFTHVMDVGRAAGSPGMVFQVLDWNTPAIEFYHSMGATVGGDGFVNAWMPL